MLHSRWVRVLGCLVIAVVAILIYVSRLSGEPDYEIHFERNVPSSSAFRTLAPALEDIRTWPQWFHSLAGARFTEDDTIDPNLKPLPSAPTEADLPLADAAGITTLTGALSKARTGAGALLNPSAPNTGGAPSMHAAPEEPPAANVAPVLIPEEARVAAGRRVLLFMDPQRGPWAKFEVLARITQVVPGRLLVMEIEDDSTHKLTRQFDHLEWRVELRPGRSPKEPTLIHGEVEAHTSHWRSRVFGQIARDVLMNQVYFMNLFKLAAFGGAAEVDQPDYLKRN